MDGDALGPLRPRPLAPPLGPVSNPSGPALAGVHLHVPVGSAFGELTLVGSSDAPDVLQGPVRHDASHNSNLDGILFRLEVDDPSAPSTGQVVASLTETGVFATWGFTDPSRNFTDPETGINRYEWAIGHSGQSDNVQPFTSMKTLRVALASLMARRARRTPDAER